MRLRAPESWPLSTLAASTLCSTTCHCTRRRGAAGLAGPRASCATLTAIASRLIRLPMWIGMQRDDVDRAATIVARAHCVSCGTVTVAANARRTTVVMAAARRLVRTSTGDTATIVVFAAALLVSPAAGGAMGGVRGGLAALVIAALSVIYGRAICRLLHVDPRAGYAALFEAVAGFLGVSLVHLAATAALNVDALVALAIDVIGAAALVAATRRMTPATSAPGAAPGSSSKGLDLVVLIACAALVAYWSRESLAAVPNARDTGLFNAWRDFLLHASEITYLRDYPAFGAQSPYLSGFSQPLYHRASYAMPALYSALAGVPSLEVATTFWMPNGVLLCAVATYVFGSALGGPVGGAAAVGTVFLLPDASTYGFQNRFLSFHWLLQIAGGSGYAIAMTLLACTVVATSAEARRVAALVRAGALVAAGAAFKVQIALTACGMVALIAVAAWRQVWTQKRVVGSLAIVVLLAGLTVWMESMQEAPHLLTGRSNPIAFLEFVHHQAAGPWSVYTWLTGNGGDVWKFLVGYALFLPAALGVFLPAIVAIWLAGHLGQDGMAFNCHSRRADSVAFERDAADANAVARRLHRVGPPLLRFDLCRAWGDGRGCSGPCAQRKVCQVVRHRAARPCDIVCPGSCRTRSATPYWPERPTALESAVCGRIDRSRHVQGGSVRPPPVDSRRAGARRQ